MFDRFTQKSIQVAMLAQEETQRLGHREVATVQLLLGLIREETALAAHLLRDAGVSLENARLEVEKIQTPGAGKYKEIPFNQHTRQVFELSLVEAEQLKDSEIDTQHLLLGLLRQSEGGAIKVLQNLGVDPTQLRNQVFRRLAEQGHPTASQFLPTPPLVNPNGTNPVNAHLELIQKILKHPEGSEAEFVRNNPGIINPECIESMASILEQQGDRKGAEFLRGLLAPRTEEKQETADNLPELPIIVPEPMQISSLPEVSVTVPEPIPLPDSPQNIEPIIDVPAPTNQEMEKFLFQLLRVTFESQADEQIVYSFLGENLDKLNDKLPEVFRNWWLSKFTHLDKDQKLKLAQRILQISSLIRKFEGGNLESNLEIALTGYNIITPVFTQAEYPEQWGIIQNCLGLTYLERVQGKREENLKQAIAYFTAALCFYSQEQFPKQRQVILGSLRKARDEISNQLKQPETDNNNLFNETTGENFMTNLREDEKKFLGNLLNSLLQYQQNPQIIYPIFQANLDLLTVDFAQRLRAQIRQFPPEVSETMAILMCWLSELILHFPLGDKTANIAIARAGYEYGLTFYKRSTNPLPWAEIMMNLGIACEEDPEADPVQKWEDAIDYYQKASQEFTREVHPEKWASTQENLGNAYRNRQQGEAEINLKTAIKYHQNALQVFTPHTNDRFWGISQHNLGKAYLALSRLNIANNEQCLESAIEHYEQALKTLKKEVYPDLWAMNQLSLGNAYSVRLRGNPHQNHEKAQRHYENALSVYTPQTYPYYYQQVKASQQRLNQLKTDSNRETPAESSFIVQVLKLTLASDGDQQKVFPFLEKNLDKLNQNFIDELVSFISDLEKEKSQINIYQAFMMGIYPFSSLMMTFPKGNREINLDIAIAGWKIVLPFFERSQNYNLPSDFSSLCGIIKLELGKAFYEKYENRWGELDVNLEEAIKYFEEGFADLKSNDTLDKELYGESRVSCQVKLGISYFNRSQIKGDPGDIEKAIDTYKLVLNLGCQENTLQWVQMNLGNAYCLRQGDPLENLTAAIECYKNSLKVCKQDDDRTKWADVHINMGQAYYRRGMLGHPKSADDIESAIEYNKNALKVYNDEKKYPLRWAGLQSALGVCYSDRQMGNRADNLELSINHLEQALTVRTKEKYPYDRANTLKNLGAIYGQRKRGDRQANLTPGIQYLEEALELFERDTVDWAETKGNLGAIYKNLAIYLKHNAESYHKAISCLKETEKIFQPPERHPQKLAIAQFELGTCYKNLGVFAQETPEANLAKAIECYRNALRYTSRKSNPFGWAEITNSLGNAYQHNGQYQQAIKCFQDTLQLHTRNAFPTDYIKTKYNLGNTSIKMGDKYAKSEDLIEDAFKSYQNAFDSYKEAINTLEEDLIYKLATDDDAKRKFGEEWYQLYSAMVALCLKLGKQNREYYATAWEYVERSKARRLVELFGQTKPDDISDDVWKDFQGLRNDITNTEKLIEDKEKSIILSEEILSQVPELEPKKAELTELKQQLNQKLNDYPRLAATQRVQYTPFSKIGEKLSDDHTVIIQWYLLEADQKFCAFIYTRQSYQPFVWESSLEDLENLQEWYQEYFVNYISNFSEWRDELSDRLERLAKILHIDELLKYLPPKCQQIILIPHRYLHLLPIHALPIKPETWQKFNPNSTPNQDNYLFECFTKGVRYAPSCQTLLMLEKRSRPNFNQLFAMGNPTEDRAFAELCVKTVEIFWKQNKQQSETKVLCGEQATKNALINELKDYLKNAHTFLYSGHGSFEFDSPLDSGLILHDKSLQLTEIFGLNLEQCRLVTLIGCETGMTDWTSITDEYIGLPSAFLWAGVSGIVSSLWTVEEKASVFLGIKLYQNLLAQTEGEKNVIQALREAQNWLRNVTGSDLNRWMLQNKLNQLRQMLNNNPLPNNDTPFSSPYYWAAFCVIGK